MGSCNTVVLSSIASTLFGLLLLLLLLSLAHMQTAAAGCGMMQHLHLCQPKIFILSACRHQLLVVILPDKEVLPDVWVALLCSYYWPEDLHGLTGAFFVHTYLVRCSSPG